MTMRKLDRIQLFFISTTCLVVKYNILQISLQSFMSLSLSVFSVHFYIDSYIIYFEAGWLHDNIIEQYSGEIT